MSAAGQSKALLTYLKILHPTSSLGVDTEPVVLVISDHDVPEVVHCSPGPAAGLYRPSGVLHYLHRLITDVPDVDFVQAQVCDVELLLEVRHEPDLGPAVDAGDLLQLDLHLQLPLVDIVTHEPGDETRPALALLRQQSLHEPEAVLTVLGQAVAVLTGAHSTHKLPVWAENPDPGMVLVRKLRLK